MGRIVRLGVLMGRLDMEPENPTPEEIRMSALALAVERYPSAGIEEQIDVARKIAAFYFGEEKACH